MISILSALFCSAVFCGLYVRLARRMQILDRPNERSSHETPIPHGGGTPLMLGLCVGFCTAAVLYGPWPGIYLALLGFGLLLCVAGIVDDIRGLSAPLRFALYAVVCALATALILPAMDNALVYGLALVLLALALLWMVNLYNFMDGVDGIAGIQCFLACAGAALLSWWQGGSSPYALFCLLLAVSHLGFLIWNWPPARLFMGDAGSIPTGFLIGGLALLGQVSGDLPLACWLILMAAFITDASWTLMWRLLTAQRVTQAHRSHAYQRLSRHWGNHLSVDLLLLAINGLWLFPMAAAALIWPWLQPILVILAFLPLLWGMAILRKLA